MLLSPLPSLQRRQVQVIDLLKKRLRIRGDFFGARRAADVDDLPFDDRPLRVFRQLVLHHGANPLRLGEIGVNRRPVLRVHFPLQASLAAEENRFLADLDLDRRAVLTELLTSDWANLLHRDVRVIAL